MIPNCKGCEEEFGQACFMINRGYHIATAKGKELVDKGKHYAILIVDDNGEIIMK